MSSSSLTQDLKLLLLQSKKGMVTRNEVIEVLQRGRTPINDAMPFEILYLIAENLVNEGSMMIDTIKECNRRSQVAAFCGKEIYSKIKNKLFEYKIKIISKKKI